jgi:tetratricopeptide (TPR) repeat protein
MPLRFASDETERMEALAALTEVSLVKHDPFEDGTPAMTVHRLVQAVARARSEASGSVQGVIARLIARLVAIYPGSSDTNNPQSWRLFSQLTPHLLSRRDEWLGDTPVVAGWLALLNSAASYFIWQTAYSQAALLLRDALAKRERVLGPEHPDTARNLNNLANLLQRQDDLWGARPLYERALATLEKAIGPEHPDTATSLRNLASLFQQQGDFANARPLYERALAIREKVFGPDHPHTAVILNKLGSLLQEQGDFAGARRLYERALAIPEKEALGPDHPETAANLSWWQDLARLIEEPWLLPSYPIHAFAVRRYVAGTFYERAMGTYEKAQGPDPNTASILHKCASHLQRLGDFAGARRHYERALAIYEKALGPEHRYTASILNNIADLLRAQGDFAGARPLHERALAIYEKALHDKALGRDHPRTKDSARVTADALDALGRTEEAKALRERYGVTEAREMQ